MGQGQRPTGQGPQEFARNGFRQQTTGQQSGATPWQQQSGGATSWQQQPEQRAPQQQQGPLVPPPGLDESTITLGWCARARLSPGPASEICAYLGRLQRENPLAYDIYVQEAAARAAGERPAGPAPAGNGIPMGDGFSTWNVPEQLPEAASWGGIVRAGPSTDTPRLDSLSEGEAITLVENTGVRMNGYDWFRIEYRDGRTGFQWGGIICGQTQPIPGAFEICG